MTPAERTTFRGGAYVGWVNATWPFATLTVERDRLRLSCLGAYEFGPSQIVALEPYGVVPFLSGGLRIVHNRNDYPARLVFWFLGDRERLLSRIEQAGFTPNGRARPRPNGIPVRSGVVAAAFIACTVFLVDAPDSGAGSRIPDAVVVAAWVTAFATVTSIRVSARVQHLVLRDGRQVGEIKSLLSLLQAVSGILSLVSTGIWLNR